VYDILKVIICFRGLAVGAFGFCKDSQVQIRVLTLFENIKARRAYTYDMIHELTRYAKEIQSTCLGATLHHYLELTICCVLKNDLYLPAKQINLKLNNKGDDIHVFCRANTFLSFVYPYKYKLKACPKGIMFRQGRQCQGLK